MSDNEKLLIEGTKLVRFMGNMGKSSEVVVPDGITQIASSAFFRCLGLEKVFLPTGIHSIGSNAFNSCEDLEIINLPFTIEYIDKGAFESCTKLLALCFPRGLIRLADGACKNCNSLEFVSLSRETKIGKDVFPENLKINYYEG